MYKSPKPQSNKVLVPQGTHLARCIGLVQIGLLPNEYKDRDDKSPDFLEKLRLTFELPEEKYVFKDGEDPKPFTISKEYTASMGMKSNLRPIVEGIIGTHLSDEEAYAFDFEELVGRPCLLTIEQGEIKSGATSSWIKSTAGLMRGMTVPDAYNKLTLLTYDNWDKETFEKLPQILKDKMKQSKQYKEKFQMSNGTDVNEGIPF